MDLAVIAEVFAEKYITAVANRRLVDHGIKPAEMILIGPVISIGHEMLIGADHYVVFGNDF